MAKMIEKEADSQIHVFTFRRGEGGIHKFTFSRSGGGRAGFTNSRFHVPEGGGRDSQIHVREVHNFHGWDVRGERGIRKSTLMLQTERGSMKPSLHARPGRIDLEVEAGWRGALVCWRRWRIVCAHKLELAC